jgi:threonine dehydratase
MMDMNREYDASLAEDAQQFLSGRIRETPIEESPALSEHLGVRAVLKMECLQITGSFKIRGAWYALHRLGGRAATGVCTCSAGNHGLGLAYAAREAGVRAVIYVPRSVDGAKLRGLERLGAEVVISPYDGFDQTEVWALDASRAQGMPFISAYDDHDVMAGNGGSLAAEILRQVPDVRTIVVPVGGGGMAAGLSIPFKEHVPSGTLVAAQLAASPALQRSLERGEAMTRMPAVTTLAGGLEGGLGKKPFQVLRDQVDTVLLVEEDDIARGFVWMLKEHRFLIEPSSAVALAACLRPMPDIEGTVVVPVTGRNVSLDTIRKLLDHGETA